MQIQGHGRGDEVVLAIEIAEDQPIRAAVEHYMAAGGGNVVAVSIEDEDEDLELDVLVGERLRPRHHVHFHKKCVNVEVAVSYAGFPSIMRSFRANKRLERVFEWAIGPDGYKLSPVDAAELVLAIPGPPPVRVNLDLHIGDLKADDCKLALALVPKTFFQGRRS
jgi:hypothetical protein